MQLVDQWRAIEERLPAGWQEVRLTLRTEQPTDLPRAAQVLGSMGAGRRGDELVLRVSRAGGVQGPESVRRLFARLDEERIWCVLEQGSVDEAAESSVPAAAPRPATPERTLADQWTDELSTLPGDWGSLLCELEIPSTDLQPRAALLCAPLNPTRVRERRAFTFRAAKRAGYGASPGMTARCLARCDEEGIAGRVSVVRLFSETDNVATQGPVFTIAGKAL